MKGFNYKKAIQALNYFAQKENGVINKMKAIKLIWLSDRLHLRRFGRPVVKDKYYALPYGPIQTNVKEFAENDTNVFFAEEEGDYRNTFLKTHGKFRYRSISDPELKVFSKSDLLIMDEVYEAFGKLDQFALSEISHMYPEWKRFEKMLNGGMGSRFQMDYLDFFKNPEADNHQIFSQDDEQLELARENFEEFFN
ncbi:Panacea domain-containing protein [uncultured Draconibacterium sp.]|uniref:Panacea domain-containing protein n=1 Tax=uncultured Draconibacterium sp. TaxID=1573823 RepID=UPI0029C833CF|nr:Panacea domain-containing protein [uncultured Draconibacterium sp.]